MRRLLALTALLLVVGRPPTAAGQQVTRPLDRIAAVVGTQPILSSQVDEEIVRFQAQGGQLPADSGGRTRMRCTA